MRQTGDVSCACCPTLWAICRCAALLFRCSPPVLAQGLLVPWPGSSHWLHSARYEQAELHHARLSWGSPACQCPRRAP